MTRPSDRGKANAPIPASAGIGLRFQHHRAVLEERPAVGWLEVHSENYFGGGAAAAYLEAARRDWPVSLHGVGLSLGGADGPDRGHLARIRALAGRIEPGLVSEHLSWCIGGGTYLADLLPLPWTEEALDVVSRNVDAAQAFLGRRILVENPSTYLRYRHSTMAEWDFLAAVAARTGCGILCDVNNIVVSACNHGFDAGHYLRALPAAAIGEIHLAGHTVRELADGRAIRIDDHGSRVPAEVWRLYERAVALFGPVPTLVEWDNAVPALPVLVEEAHKAARILDEGREVAHASAA